MITTSDARARYLHVAQHLGVRAAHRQQTKAALAGTAGYVNDGLVRRLRRASHKRILAINPVVDALLAFPLPLLNPSSNGISITLKQPVHHDGEYHACDYGRSIHAQRAHGDIRPGEMRAQHVEQRVMEQIKSVRHAREEGCGTRERSQARECHINVIRDEPGQSHTASDTEYAAPNRQRYEALLCYRGRRTSDLDCCAP